MEIIHMLVFETRLGKWDQLKNYQSAHDNLNDR